MVEEFIPLSSSRLHKRRASDSTPSRISNREDILNGDKQTMHNNGKFRATRLWNDIVLRFRTDMPLKRHRRQLTFFDNSFTGREAVDFLMVELPRLLLEGREVDRSNCVALLQKFMNQGLFKRPRTISSDIETFKDNATLYVFTGDYNSNCAARIPRLMQRTNSFSGGDADHVRRNVISPMRQRYICVESPLNWTPFELPKSPPKRIEHFNRRLSSSHGNLMSFVATPQIFEFNSADSIAETIDSIRAEVNYSINPSPERDFKTPVMSKSKALWNDVDRRVSLTENKCVGSETEVPLPNLVKKYKSSVKIREKDSIRESAYEWLTFGRRKKNITPSKNTEQSILDTNPVHEEERNNSRKRSLRSRSERKHCVINSNTRLQEQDTDYASLKVTHRSFTDRDTLELWKNCLLGRLRRVLTVESLEFISWDIIGENVRWNCEKVGASGVVKSRNDQEEFSEYLKRLMRYLEQFPFPSGTSNVITYKDNQEVNVFKTICSHLVRKKPMLLNVEASALLHIISFFHKMANSKSMSPSCCLKSRTMHLETEFSTDTPQTRLVQRKPGSDLCSLSSQSSPFSDRHDEVTAIKMKGLSEGIQLAFQVSSDDSMRYVDGVSPSDIAMTRFSFGRRSDKLLCPLAFDDVMRLPGLKQSPDLMKTLDELCITPQTSLKTQLSAGSMTWSDLPAVSSFIIGNTESVFQLPRDISESLLESVSLILITLPPPRRRRLHHLIRFMNKLSANHCIQLDKFRENRYVVLEGLAQCVVQCDGEYRLSTAQCMQLVILLMDHEKTAFKIPVSLREEVEQAVRMRRREKLDLESSDSHMKCFMNEKKTVLSDKQQTPIFTSNRIQFCEVIKASEYEEQKQNQNGDILNLLDQICHDENLTIEEKRKKLKKFKKTYPSIYAQRFPSPQLTHSKKKDNAVTTGFLSRLFGR